MSTYFTSFGGIFPIACTFAISARKRRINRTEDNYSQSKHLFFDVQTALNVQHLYIPASTKLSYLFRADLAEVEWNVGRRHSIQYATVAATDERI